MNTLDMKISREIKKELVKEFNVIDIKAFGSRSREDGDQYSDLDIFINVEKVDRDIKERIRTITWKIGLSHGIVISPLIFSRDEIETSALKSSPIVKSIMYEGISI